MRKPGSPAWPGAAFYADPPSPLMRPRITDILDVGVCLHQQPDHTWQGPRVGIMAGSGWANPP